MALQDLLDTLERDGAARARGILDAAQRRADEILAVADAEAERKRNARLAETTRRLEAAAASETVSQRRKAQAVVLEARNALLDLVFAQAAGMLDNAARSDAYRAALPEHVRQALAFLDGCEAVVRCRPELAPHVPAGNGVTPETDAGVPPGFVVRAADGSVTVDQTLPGRLSRMKPDLSIAVLARLEVEQ